MSRGTLLAVLLVGAALAGCIGTEDPEELERTQAPGEEAEWGTPIPETIESVQHLAQVTLQGREVSGAGIWTHGDYAYVSGLNSGFHVVDVSTPDDPEIVGQISGEDVYSRDADLLEYPDRSVIVLATQSGGMTFVNVTDPTEPEILFILEIEPNHNVAVVPNSTIVYNSPSTGEGRANEIVDASDPERPEVIGEFGDYGCHDITFYTDTEKQRAYCAGVDVTQIFDISDPTAPELVTTVSNPCMDDDSPVPWSNCGGLHHTAFVNHDASILVIGDEFQGGAGPGCGYHVRTDAGSASTPIGALWFYDISEEENPELQGWFAPTVPTPRHTDAVTGTLQENPTSAPYSASCTAHFGDLVPGKEMAVMAWYHAGVIVVDFSDPANPRQVDQWNEGTTTWDAQVHNGYVFTGDIDRGLDAFRFLGQQ